MDFNQITFFTKPDARIYFHIESDNSQTWPITLKINKSTASWADPKIVIYLNSREQLLDFVASFHKAFDNYADTWHAANPPLSQEELQEGDLGKDTEI